MAALAWALVAWVVAEPLPAYEAFLKKARSGAQMTIVYLGGSITVGAGVWPPKGTNAAGLAFDTSAYNGDKHSWRARTFSYLASNFQSRPDQFTQVNAAIGGTPSELGAYRLEKHVLRHKPDFLFVEFAVNDNGRAALSQDSDAPGSIQRTYASIVTRALKQNPDLAIFFPISSHRILQGSPSSGMGERIDQSGEIVESVAHAFRIPFARAFDAYYKKPLPPGLTTATLYEGPDTAGSYVHPAPDGYRVYAEEIIGVLGGLFSGQSFAFKKSSVPGFKTSPANPLWVTPEELLATSHNCEILKPALLEFQTPVLAEDSCLSGTGKWEIVRRFKGVSVALWFDAYTAASIDVILDGKPLGQYKNNSPGPASWSGRFASLAFGLDPSAEHVIQLTPSVDDKSTSPKMLLRGLLIDQGK